MKHVVVAFGRMNPITSGHEKLINSVVSMAKEHNADHEIRVSHSQDSAKNPLSSGQKLGHLKKLFPKVNFSASSKESPSLLQHLKELHGKGYTHVTFVAGSDRVPEYQETINKYNKPESEGGLYHFKHINVVSAGHRDPDSEGTTGMSASKMRGFAKSGDYDSFRKGLPSTAKPEHAKQMYDDVRSGMKISESFVMSFRKWLIDYGTV